MDCKIEDCTRPARSRGWCNAHYCRWKDRGDPLAGRPILPVDLGSCAVKACDNAAVTRGWCFGHYSRVRKHGDPQADKPLRPRRDPAIGARWVDESSGYAWVRVERGARGVILEHRHVMSESLGRPLLSSEEVHHRNGVRDDNRLDNLELWVHSQPAGARVEDAVEHARTILQRYAPDLLAATVAPLSA